MTRELSTADLEALSDRRQEEAREWYGLTECPQCGASNQTEAAEDEDCAPYCSEACQKRAEAYRPSPSDFGNDPEGVPF